MGKLLLANIKGPQGDSGPVSLSDTYSILNPVYSGGADPTGTVLSKTAIDECVAAAVSAKEPVIVPGGTYLIDSALDWRIPGLTVRGSGFQTSVIKQVTDNTQIVRFAGQHQDISNLGLRYVTQQASANSSAIAMSFGDDTVGSCFESKFSNIFIQLAQRALAVDPTVAAAAGLFSCEFENMHILGYSKNAIALSGNNGGGLSNCTGCVFTNTYIHNNFSGSAAGCSSFPLYLESWDEVIFNQLNIEHGESFNFDVIGLSGVGNCKIEDLHIESIQLSGSTGVASYINAENSGVIVDGLTVRYGTMSGTVRNSVVRFSGSGTSVATINGLNEGSENTFSHGHPYADFGGVANCIMRVTNVKASKTDSSAVNAGAGCLVKVDGLDRSQGKPTGALAETMPRSVVSTFSTGVTSGSVYGHLISLEAGQLVSHLTFITGNAVKTGGTHGWYALLDLNSVVLAVSADQTDSATKWGTASTPYTLDMVTPYTVPVDGDYYMVECVVESGGSMPNFDAGPSLSSGIIATSPAICGSFGSGKTTPPTVGSSLSTVSGNTGFNLYGYVS